MVPAAREPAQLGGAERWAGRALLPAARRRAVWVPRLVFLLRTQT